MLLTFLAQTKKAMDTLSLFFIFFTCIFLNSLIQQSLAAQLCSTSTCSPSEPIIRFPFRLQNLQPTFCVFPGFDLFCDAFNRTLVQLPNSGRFTVNAIDYAAQNIWLNDPEYCLSKRLLHLNLSGSPFNGVFSQEFTFFNCTLESGKYGFDPIGCLSGDNYSVFAASSERATAFFASKCEWVATVAVPVEWDFFAPLDTSILSDDIRLTWSWPRCRRCESRGGRCGFRGQNTTQIGCTNADRHGNLSLFIFIFIFIASSVFSCFP